MAPDNLTEFVEGLCRVMDPDEEVRQMVESGIDYVKAKYDIHPIVDRLIEVYSSRNTKSSTEPQRELLVQVGDE